MESLTETKNLVGIFLLYVLSAITFITYFYIRYKAKRDLRVEFYLDLDFGVIVNHLSNLILIEAIV